MGRLYEQLKEYSEEEFYPYHMPGHKRRLYGDMPEQMMEADITEIDGFDNLHQPEGILKELQEKAAALYGAEESFYLINGSTCGILTAISAAVPRGGHILMARNCHKSAYHACYLRNLTVSYLYPPMNTEYDIYDVITPEQIRKALCDKPDINAVFLVSPTYEGRIADIEAIAELVHEKGIPLIVDEAHGAHLGLAEELHKNSCQQGADIVIHSVHKTLPAMTQTALLHVNGNRVDRERLRRFLHIYQSSSPSYILMASIDNALQLVEQQGAELFGTFRKRYNRLMNKLSHCKYFQFPEWDKRQDMGKLVISGKKIGMSGQEIYDSLLQKYHLQMEMAAGSYCLAMFTIGDSDEAYDRMCDALFDMEQTMEASHGFNKTALSNTASEQNSLCDVFADGSCEKDALSLTRAWDMESELIPLKQAVGRFVGEFINLYPPGVPLLVPGEKLQEQQYQRLMMYMEQGLKIQGVSETAPFPVRVLK